MAAKSKPSASLSEWLKEKERKQRKRDRELATVLESLTQRIEKMEKKKTASSSPVLLGGRSKSSWVERVKETDDPKETEKILKSSRKKFAERTPVFYTVKQDDKKLLATIKDMMDDLARIRKALRKTLEAIEDEVDQDVVTTLQEVIVLTKASEASAKFRLWQKVGSHVAPTVPKARRDKEMVKFSDIGEYTAKMQELELQHCQVSATQKLAAGFAKGHDGQARQNQRESTSTPVPFVSTRGGRAQQRGARGGRGGPRHFPSRERASTGEEASDANQE